jgi:hypothetical protein
VQVDGFDLDLSDADAGFSGLEQQGQLVFETLPRDGAEPFEQARRIGSQPGLGIAHSDRGQGFEQPAGHLVPEGAAQRHPAGEPTAPEHHLAGADVDLAGHPHDVGNLVLAVGVGADDHFARVVPPGDGEPGLECMAFSAVLRVAVHGGAVNARQGEDLVVVGAGTVVHDQDVGRSGMGL